MEKANSSPTETENRLVANALKEGIPIERFREIQNLEKRSRFEGREAKKALEFIIDSEFDRETLEPTLDIFLDKLTKAVKASVIAELMSQNWRVS